MDKLSQAMISLVFLPDFLNHPTTLPTFGKGDISMAAIPSSIKDSLGAAWKAAMIWERQALRAGRPVLAGGPNRPKSSTRIAPNVTAGFHMGFILDFWDNIYIITNPSCKSRNYSSYSSVDPQLATQVGPGTKHWIPTVGKKSFRFWSSRLGKDDFCWCCNQVALAGHFIAQHHPKFVDDVDGTQKSGAEFFQQFSSPSKSWPIKRISHQAALSWHFWPKDSLIIYNNHPSIRSCPWNWSWTFSSPIIFLDLAKGGLGST